MVYPAPAQIKLSNHRFAAGRNIQLRLAVDWIRRNGTPSTPELQINPSASMDSVLILDVELDNSLPEQGYRLELGERVSYLFCNELTSFLYGVETVRQLVDTTGTLPVGTVTDSPVLPHRVYMLDISRDRVPNFTHLEQLLKLLSRLRYNGLQLYTEHTFAFPGHAIVWGMASAYTGGDIERITSMAAQFGIELIPNFNSFGHFERWLQHDEYRHLAESPQGFIHPSGENFVRGSTLYPDDTSLRFVQGLHQAMLPAFSSKRFNIGGDEPWELGTGRSKGRCDTHGKHSVYCEHLGKILDSVHQRQLIPQFWAEVLLEDPGHAHLLPKNAEALLWGYEADHPFDQQATTLQATGIPFWVCPGTSTWNTLGGRWQNARQNIDSAIAAATAHGATGMLLTDWGDGGHHQQPVISLPSLYAAAAAAWTGKPINETSVQQAMARDLGKNGNIIAETIFQLGGLPSVLPPSRPNCSPINDWLFASGPVLVERLHSIPQEAIDAVWRKLGSYRETLENRLAKPANTAALDQVLFTCKLMELAVARARAYKSRNPNRQRTARRAALAELIGAYEDLWISTSRPGGLHQSSARLRDQLGSI